MLAPILSFLTGTSAKFLAAILATLALLVGLRWAEITYKGKLLAEYKVARLEAEQAAREQDHQKAIAALTATATAARLRADNLEQTKRSIGARPPTTSCVGSPAVGDALRSLTGGVQQRTPGGPAQAPTSPR